MNKEKFVKHDFDKPCVSMVDPRYILGTADVLTLGAMKYSRDNWKHCDDKNRYKDSLMRHVLAYLSGERNDPETGLSHLYHASCNLMFLDWFDSNMKENTTQETKVQASEDKFVKDFADLMKERGIPEPLCAWNGIYKKSADSINERIGDIKKNCPYCNSKETERIEDGVDYPSRHLYRCQECETRFIA